MSKEKQGSIYICHTYYHVYVSMLKEFAKSKSEQGNATIILSTMSTQFEDLESRLKALNYFKDVLVYEEKNFTELPEVDRYHHPSKNFIASIYNRYRFTKAYGKAQEKYVPVDLSNYKDIYVFCDSDPIGFYLNYKHIYYHAVEDGLDTLRNCDLARADNASHFKLKTFLSKKLNIIFVQNGYGKYCLDMEVNDISVLNYHCPYYVECSRKELMDRLTQREKDMLVAAFVKQADAIRELIANKNKKTVMILTEPLCDLETRKRLFKDLAEKYSDEYEVIFKQHPRDHLDYVKELPEYILVDRTVPMEMLNFFEGFHVDLIVSVFTELGCIQFADEKLRLGRDFMDAYEDVEIHKSRFESR